LASSGDIKTHYNSTTGISYKEVTFTENARNTIAFVIFVYLWTIGFLEAIGHLLSSHAILTWYFSNDKSSIGSSQAYKSAFISFRYHSGTAAAGSFLIAILRGIRIILEYVQHKLEILSNRHPSKGCCSCTFGIGTMARFLLCTMSCCICCFEGFVRFVNKHAYIQTAYYGTPFYSSAKRAFFLLVRNLGRVAAVTMIADFVLLTGKLSITLSCAGIAYYYIENNMNDKVTSKILPSLFIAFIAFGCSTLFLGVASAACDTILQAYIIDEESLNNGNIDIEEKNVSDSALKRREIDSSLRDHIEEQRRFALSDYSEEQRLESDNEPLTPRSSGVARI
jgi:choline transporter-like protein 2/4/5